MVEASTGFAAPSRGGRGGLDRPVIRKEEIVKNRGGRGGDDSRGQKMNSKTSRLRRWGGWRTGGQERTPTTRLG